MLDIRPFEPGDVMQMRPQVRQQTELVSMGDWQATLQEAARCGPAWTGWLNSEPIGCAGVVLRWPGRAFVWCLIGEGIPKPAWIGLHRAVLARLTPLRELGVRRIEADVLNGFAAGRRGVHLLGFDDEGLMRCYGPDGADYRRCALLLTEA